MKGMKYHDYIWDLGGTLLDNYETSTAAFVETLAQYGIEQEHDRVYEALKVSTAFAIEKFAPDIENFLENYNDEGELSDEIDYESKNIRVGIIGRVNVGKSSLLNALVKESRAVVSDVAGTTIDPVNEIYEHDGRVFEFVDTAGIRKRGKIEGIERYALNRTEKILEETDVALLVLDSSEPLTELDERIAGIASKFELGVIIVLNKWDKSSEEFDELCKEIKDRFKFLSKYLSCCSK